MRKLREIYATRGQKQCVSTCVVLIIWILFGVSITLDITDGSDNQESTVLLYHSLVRNKNFAKNISPTFEESLCNDQFFVASTKMKHSDPTG